MAVGPKKHRLTSREVQVVRLISLGCTTAETAAILGLARHDVDAYKARAKGKLGTNKIVLLTRLAIRLKLTDMNDKLTRKEQRLCGRTDDGWNN